MNSGKKQNETSFCFSSNSLLGGGEGGSEASSVIYFENLRTLSAAGVTTTIYNPINN